MVILILRLRQTHYQPQIEPSFVHQSGQTRPVAIINNNTNEQSQPAGNINNVHDYKIWSIFNILLLLSDH